MLRELFDALLRERRNPTPTILPTAHPDGRRALALVQKGESYEVVTLDGETAQVPSHRFDRYEALTEYVRHRAASGQVDPMTAVVLVGFGRAVFDAADTDNAAVQVAAAHPLDPLFFAWQRLSRWCGTKEAIDHLRDIGPCDALLDADGGDPVEIQITETLIEQLSRVTVSADMKIEEQISRLGMIELQGRSAKTATSAKLPDSFTISTRVLDQVGPVRPVRFLVETRIEDGRLELRIVVSQLDWLQQLVAGDLANDIREDLGDGWCVVLGSWNVRTERVGPYLGPLGLDMREIPQQQG